VSLFVLQVLENLSTAVMKCASNKKLARQTSAMLAKLTPLLKFPNSHIRDCLSTALIQTSMAGKTTADLGGSSAKALAALLKSETNVEVSQSGAWQLSVDPKNASRLTLVMAGNPATMTLDFINPQVLNLRLAKTLALRLVFVVLSGCSSSFPVMSLLSSPAKSLELSLELSRAIGLSLHAVSFLMNTFPRPLVVLVVRTEMRSRRKSGES
jgi:hypothetical protein